MENIQDNHKSLLSICNLVTTFDTEDGKITPVDNINLEIKPGKTLGVVGESGCGKSITALSIMRLIPAPNGNITKGEILFNGRDLLKLDKKEMHSIRGKQIGMIFQEPMTALNPVYTVGEQIAETLRFHLNISPQQAIEKSIQLLEQVGIPSPEDRVNEYPHMLSGGMRQRVMIAMALSCKPELLIADEPTTALDVTIQAQILSIMKEMQKKINMSILFITHDLGVVAEMCDEVVVMYTGQIIEKADIKTIFKNPRHPYTIGLLRSIPRLETHGNHLDTIKGIVPSLLDLPKGCTFAGRCEFCKSDCLENKPTLKQTTQGSWVACFHPQGKEKEKSESEVQNGNA